MKIQFLQKEIRLHDRQYTILTPTFQTKNIFANKFDTDNFMLYGNQQALQYLACTFIISAENRDKIVYLTNMEKDLPNHLLQHPHQTKNHELVFLHHSLQLKVSEWKEIRQKLHQQKGRIRSFEINPRKFSDKDYEDYVPLYYKENNDKILIQSEYDTLFLIGSKIVFEYASGVFEPLSRTGAGAFLRTHGRDHYHLDRFMRDSQALCVDYYDKVLWTEHLGEDE